jgi:hypothetical protein
MDLYTFGPLQQQHTHKNVESCGGGRCCLFLAGQQEKNKINRQQRRIEIIRMGKKKMRKEKSGARTLGL